MFVVALVMLGTTVETEAPCLAADLGVSAYDAALLIRAAPPLVLLRTEDRARALSFLGALRERKHDAVAFDPAAVTPSDAMTHVRRFRFAADALVDIGPNDVEQELPFEDILALVRAQHDTRQETTSTKSESQFSFGRAALSGGLVNKRTVTKEVVQRTETRESVLYLFRRTGGRPWLIQATRARYDGFGVPLKPSQLENFELFVQTLRDRARSASFDDRLLAVRAGPERIRFEGKGRQSESTAGTADLFAHIVAMVLARRASDVYR